MLSVRVLVAFGKTEVDDVNIILGALSGANQEIVRLNVAMDNALLMHLLNSLNLIEVKLIVEL